ncbi:sortase-dependent protein [Streptomyces antibioticus]|uniref:sortase-dependent protein n=1 Tax=Streptomyces antibioticus TaxID=1890 RepID=UPI0036BB506A
MRRTVLGSLALAATAVLAGALPAFADGTRTPSPVPTPSESRPAEPRPSESRPAQDDATPVPAPTRPTDSRSDQVTAVPRGGADTGEVNEAGTGSGTGGSAGHGGLIGGGAAVVAGAAGAGFVLVRRRRTTGA